MTIECLRDCVTRTIRVCMLHVLSYLHGAVLNCSGGETTCLSVLTLRLSDSCRVNEGVVSSAAGAREGTERDGHVA